MTNVDRKRASIMKAIIVCTSVSHGNTRRVAEVMGRALNAPVVTPEQFDPATLPTYDLVGFGSGIYFRSFHPDLRRLVKSLPQGQQPQAFVFATSGFPEARHLLPFSRPLVQLLKKKGFEVVDTFSCRGFDTWLPLKLVGGIRKGHPTATDLKAANTFADNLQTPRTTGP
ncbi:flavodoxin family protein [Actinophytocola sediminis]